VEKRKVQDLLSRARVQISQNASHTDGSSQIVNLNILLDRDTSLKAITHELLELSLQKSSAFQLITDFLRNVTPSALDPLEQSLVQAWLRKVVAANHIKFAKQFADRKGYQLIMLDTSLYDQPSGSWLDNDDFKKVVDFDGTLARFKLHEGVRDGVLRILFVPDAQFLEDQFAYIVRTLVDQVSKGITCAVARADYLALKDARYVCDLFMVRGHLVCAIEKPFWQFELIEQPGRVRAYFEMVDVLLASDYIIIARTPSPDDIAGQLKELQAL